MAFSIAMRFQGPARIAVDPLALQWNASGSFLWLVREGRAVQVPVRVIQREAGAILVEGELREGEPVVVEGVQDLRPGSAVTPAAEAQPTAAALTAPRRAAGSDL